MPSSLTPIRNSDVPLEPLPPPVPEATFWQKYSLHHEFPLSALASFVLHFSVVLFLAMLGAMVFNWSTQNDVPLTGVVFMDDGGGSGKGEGGPDRGTSTDADATPVVPTEPEKFDTTALPDNVDVIPNLERPKTTLPTGPNTIRSRGERDDDGSGYSSGRFVGDGPPGPSRARTQRMKRMDRWHLTINYRTGSEYLDRLANLQGVLAVPVDGGEGKFLVYSDLNKRPATGEAQTARQVEAMNRLYWRNDEPDVMRQIAPLLGLNPPPKYVYTFLPQDLEKVLLEKELAYGKRSEADLNAKNYETAFEAERSNGKWVVKVLSQTVRKQKD